MSRHAPTAPTLAQNLTGVDLGNEWTVLEKINHDDAHTGGYFSVGYKAIHTDGREGYLKAIDYTRAFQPELTSQERFKLS
jgi:hypothetical protein